jgi:GNAT superfamily N-acetyltransferase
MKLARRLATATCAAFALVGPAAFACGVCIEDKVAAAYDHATVQEARARGEVVVFAEVRGRGAAAHFVAAAREAAKRVPGVAAQSVRAADEPASLSFALNPRARSPEAVLAAIERAASAAAVRLELLKVMR